VTRNGRVVLAATVGSLSAIGIAIAASIAPAERAVQRASIPNLEGALLPDLVQEVPRGLKITRVGARGRTTYRLGFRSAVRNVGAGPLIVDGRRMDIGTRDMEVSQLVVHEDASQTRIDGSGRLRYTRSPDHQHWHYLGFERYELRGGRDFGLRVRDRKTGFCLGDRYDVRGEHSGAPARPHYRSRCGLGATQAVRMRQGISVGYGDDYVANLEGQWLRLNGLREGLYVLVHRADPELRLTEARRNNNTASLLLRLRWRDGEPHVRVVRRCAGSARCEAR
jgi:hypothetical protein